MRLTRLGPTAAKAACNRPRLDAGQAITLGEDVVPTAEPDDMVTAVLTSVTRAGAHHNVAVWAVVEQFFIKAEQTRKRAAQEAAT